MTVRYSFDTSSLLNGRRDLFKPTVFKALWSNIESLIATGDIRCVDVVKEELARREGDETHEWVQRQEGLFVPLTEDVQGATTSILAQHPKLVGVGGQRSMADPFVIALAMVRSGAVVTEEIETGNINRPKIPDVCRAIGVSCINLMEFIEDQQWIF